MPGANLDTYAHVQLFSPWRYNVDKASRALLEQQGWQHPAPETLPTACGIVRSYLEPLAKHPALAPHIRFDPRVVAVSRASVDEVKREAAPFALRIHTPDSEREFRGKAVITPRAPGISRIQCVRMGCLALSARNLKRHIRLHGGDV